MQVSLLPDPVLQEAVIVENVPDTLAGEQVDFVDRNHSTLLTSV
jgi:hypothetical protein